ncbi:MAG: lytic transglycosylase domain-containing protein [Syntrophaceticus sp.]|jgi:soluble lytic murein transglycosylase-like protein|nr:lytic transglycosylase domain-containing protein [Syntrophaceticus sp.]MDD3315498.1 lytic transglycosylase domain-containing protein [Syntrophaceticus sp.]MDD4360681.1 lytic transglycosylase domain-containing protein [Syntrophaceticus sp.]MDD4783290.1 lytic transglycosylase domain-containing protein [Syntrophaceticus sp.]HBG22649.1 lytic transglycosylase [Peptococcaceae bacterium]
MELRGICTSGIQQDKKAVSNTGNSKNFNQVFEKTMDKAKPYEYCFQMAASKYQIDPAVLKAVAKAESNFNPQAVSRSGALGLMQFMPGTAQSLGINPLDPAQSIQGAAKYLSSLLDQFQGNLTLALAAYNAGPGAVKKYGGIPPYQETQNYVSKVTKLISKYGSSVQDPFIGNSQGVSGIDFLAAGDQNSALILLLKEMLLLSAITNLR